MQEAREIILSDNKQMQIVKLNIEGKERKFYIGVVKEYTIISNSFQRKFKKIKLNLIEM